MSSAKITLFSFAHYMEMMDDDLFSNLSLPSGIDKDTLTGNILLRGGEFECVYSDPYFIQKSIGIWSSKWYRTFEKWVEALSIEYNPLENYDRMETYTDYTQRDLAHHDTKENFNLETLDTLDKKTLDTENKRTLDTVNKRTLDTEDKETLDTTDTTTNEVSAFDSNSYQASDKSTLERDGTDTMNHSGTDIMNNSGTDTMNNTGTEADQHSGSITNGFNEQNAGAENENVNVTHNARIHGNIGVTTSQQMLESQLNIATWNLYEHITDIFLEEFIIPVYS